MNKALIEHLRHELIEMRGSLFIEIQRYLKTPAWDQNTVDNLRKAYSSLCEAVHALDATPAKQ